MAIVEITIEDARGRLGEFRVVDVRADHEFHGPLGRLPGSQLVPLPDLGSRVGELPRDRPLLLVCRSGRRSATACEQLGAQGFEDPTNLIGGMIAWNEAGYAVDRTPPDSPAALRDSIVAWVAQVSGDARDAVLEHLRRPVADAGHSIDDPSPEAITVVLGAVEAVLRASGAPPDLDLSLAAFREANTRFAGAGRA